MHQSNCALSLVYVFSWYICFTQVLSARRRFPNSSMSEMAEKCGVAPRVPTEPHFSYVFVYFRRPLQSYRPRYSIPNRYERISKTAHRANEYTNGTNEHKKKNPAKSFFALIHMQTESEWVFPDARCNRQFNGISPHANQKTFAALRLTFIYIQYMCGNSQPGSPADNQRQSKMVCTFRKCVFHLWRPSHNTPARACMMRCAIFATRYYISRRK